MLGDSGDGHESDFAFLAIGLEPFAHGVASFGTVDSVGVNNRGAGAFVEDEPGEGGFYVGGLGEEDHDEVLGGLFGGSGHGIGADDHGFLRFVSFQNRICARREGLAIFDLWIIVDRHHVNPFREIGLAFGRELMQIVLRVPVEIVLTHEGKGGFGGLLRVGAAGER